MAREVSCIEYSKNFSILLFEVIILSTLRRCSKPRDDPPLPAMNQNEKNAFGTFLNLSYEGETRVVLANGDGIHILGTIIKAFSDEVG